MAKTPKDIIKDYAALNQYLQDEMQFLRSINDFESERQKNTELTAERQKVINDLISKQNDLTTVQKAILNSLIEEQRTAVTNEKAINSSLVEQKKLRSQNLSLAKTLNDSLKQGWKYLQESDKIIKSTILGLGMSGAKAEMMRASFEQSSLKIAQLGGNLEDIQNIMQGYADETGRARVLSAEMVKDTTLIGKGTKLGVEQATRLAGQFENMGMNIRTTMEYVQGVVDTSERMGVNSTKVLKTVSDNFKKLQTYTFKNGVEGMAKMAQFSEKFRTDIGAALNAADISRTLEGAVDLAANLQIMGGEFAKTDPFEMLFLSRNDPEKFTEKISEMTRGVVSFRKMADGTFQKFISPADRDRLASVSKSLGMSVEQITEMTLKRAEMDKMAQQMQGMGLSDREKELIKGAATFNNKTGKFEAMVGGQMRDISSLTSEQAKMFSQETKTLEERTKESQTWNDVYNATLMELKSALLPLLKTVNKVLVSIRPVVENISNFLTKGNLGWLKVGGLFITGALLWKTVSARFETNLSKWIEGGKFWSKGGASTIASKGASGGENIGGSAGGAGKGIGMKALGTGAGVGIAAAGIGGGIAIAAVGISKLADSMAKLTPEQAKTLKSIINSLGLFVGIGAAVAVSLGLLGGAGTAAIPVMLAFGGTVLMIGAAIGIAAAGIGYMANGFANLVTSAKDAGTDLVGVAAGISAIGLSLATFSIGSFGLIAFNSLVNKISKNAPALTKVGAAFKEINLALRGSEEDYIAIQKAINSITNADIKSSGLFSELSNLLKNPLRVIMDTKGIQIVDNITLNIDGQKFMEKVYKTDLAKTKDHEVARGQSNGRG